MTGAFRVNLYNDRGVQGHWLRKAVDEIRCGRETIFSIGINTLSATHHQWRN